MAAAPAFSYALAMSTWLKSSLIKPADGLFRLISAMTLVLLRVCPLTTAPKKFLGLGAAVAMLLELFDNTVKSIEQLERRGLPILSIIPAIGNHNAKNKSAKRYLAKDKNVSKLQRRLITHEDPKSPISEAYRSLRTSLMYTKKGSKGSIMVSSPGPGPFATPARSVGRSGRPHR